MGKTSCECAHGLETWLWHNRAIKESQAGLQMCSILPKVCVSTKLSICTWALNTISFLIFRRFFSFIVLLVIDQCEHICLQYSPQCNVDDADYNKDKHTDTQLIIHKERKCLQEIISSGSSITLDMVKSISCKSFSQHRSLLKDSQFESHLKVIRASFSLPIKPIGACWSRRLS